MRKLAQQDQGRTARRLAAFDSGDGGTINAEFGGKPLLGPTEPLAKRLDVNNLIHAASVCITHTACQVEMHTDGVQHAHMSDGEDDELLRPDQARRLREARLARGFKTAKDAAKYFGWNYNSYSQHERGIRGIGREVERYAKAYRTTPAKLMFGGAPQQIDETREASGAPPTHSGSFRVGAIPINGFVDASGRIEWETDEPETEFVNIASGADIGALIVRGDSQYPRFLDGEVILYEIAGCLPNELLGQYAIVRTNDGRTLIKILRPNPQRRNMPQNLSRGAYDFYQLESHNRAPENDVGVLYAHRYIGVLSRPGTAAPQGRKR